MSDNRTEKATPKRREDARKKGQIARRPELAAVTGFLAALLMLRVTGDSILSRARHLFADTMSHAGQAKALDVPAAHELLINAFLDLAALTLPIIVAALAAGIAVNFAQGGLTLSTEALKPKMERFNPLANFKRVFSGNSVVELLKGLLKLGGIVAVCYGLFTHAVNNAPTLVGAPAAQTFASIGQLAYDLSLRAGGVLALVALLDYGYGRYKHAKSLRMTKQEVKDEYKQQEGDPHVKGQRRRAARALTQRRIAAEVPHADVVVTNPTHFAVALRYDREKDAAPTVVAKGADLMAKRIREIAQANMVAVVENPPLARTLYRTVEIGHIIPPELFRAAAELLAYVYRLREHAQR
jgi:flagellar biosynthetic protein FlhB